MNLSFQSFLCCISFSVLSFQGFSQDVARVEGLKDNKEYMSLMKDQHKLEVSQDSVISLITKQKLRLSTLAESQRIEATSVILDLEGALFEVRSKLGNIKNRSGIIEQEYIIASLESGDIAPVEDALFKENNTDTDILKTDRLKKEIPTHLYNLILTGDNVKAEIANDFRFLMGNVTDLADIITAYSSEGDQVFGDSLAMHFDSLANDIYTTDVNATKRWNNVYEAQIDQYNRLLDKFNAPSTIVDKLNEKSRKVRNEESNIEIEFIAPCISKYVRQHYLVMLYEKEIAEILNLTAASKWLDEAMHKIDLKQYDVKRLYLPLQDMIEYKPLKRASSTAHTSKKPPTELIIPTRGELHKVEIGTYSKKLTTFTSLSKVSPAEFMQLESGKYRYWAGAYKTVEKAQAASKMLNKLGLRTKVASWKDGVNSVDDGLSLTKFKIEMPFYTSTIIDIVEANAPGKKITKNSDKDGVESYSIALFVTKSEAQKVAALIGNEAKVVIAR